MPPEIWLNGCFVPRDEARVSFFDAGLQHGVGLFETLRARHGRVFRVEQHLRRLAGSAKALSLSDSIQVEPLAEAVRFTLQRSGLQEARIRVTVTGGDLNLLARADPEPAALPTIAIVAQRAAAFPETLFERGVQVLVAEPRANTNDFFAGHKTLNYWPRLAVLRQAAAAGADEALWFTTEGRLASACVGNVFLVRSGALATPPARSADLHRPVLPGVTRAAVMEVAAETGVPLKEEWLTMSDLLAADEVFLTNSAWGVLPVVRVERHTVGAGKPGEITAHMRAMVEALINEETGGQETGADGADAPG